MIAIIPNDNAAINLYLVSMIKTKQFEDAKNANDPKIITESTWNKRNALFIVIGDLVDGRRNRDVNDKYGSFELLIHLFLYTFFF